MMLEPLSAHAKIYQVTFLEITGMIGVKGCFLGIQMQHGWDI